MASYQALDVSIDSLDEDFAPSISIIDKPGSCMFLYTYWENEKGDWLSRYVGRFFCIGPADRILSRVRQYGLVVLSQHVLGFQFILAIFSIASGLSLGRFQSLDDILLIVMCYEIRTQPLRYTLVDACRVATVLKSNSEVQYLDGVSISVLVILHLGDGFLLPRIKFFLLNSVKVWDQSTCR